VVIIDEKGKQLDATVSYLNRTVALTGLDLTPGGHYRLVVLSTVRDVSGRNIASEYDLDLVGPRPNGHGDHNPTDGTAPSPSPSPSPLPTPSPSAPASPS
jgi:hypothetical protein